MIFHRFYNFLLFISVFFAGCIFADDLEEIVVESSREHLLHEGALSHYGVPSDKISHCAIEQANANHLSEAVKKSAGVSVNNECSMCGIKRILMNGLRGEQTTLLVDGLPVHTLISGFYTVDAIPTTGVDFIEIARGPGAALIAPEAMGGVINMVSTEASKNGLEVDLSIGENHYQKFGMLATGKTKSGKTRATLIAQYDDTHQTDADHNGVSESPQLTNGSYIARLSQEVTARDNLVMRYAHLNSEIFGGPVLGRTYKDGKIETPSQVMQRFTYGDARTPSQELFADGDVRQPFQGKAWETAEWIKTERDELSVSWGHDINEAWRTRLSSTYAKHQQDSFYEGFDYYAVDKMYFCDARVSGPLSDRHEVVLGIDFRHERLGSFSFAGQQNPSYAADSFTHRDMGLYIHDKWQMNDWLALSLALRIDDIDVDFIGVTDDGGHLSATVISPRVNVSLMHDEDWMSWLSLGRGYRAPLSFFESDHGILDGDQGFAMDIQALETSWSLVYSTRFKQSAWEVNATMAYTFIDHLTTLSETEAHVPLLTQLTTRAEVLAMDISLGVAITPYLGIRMTLENYRYNDIFKSAYTIAPVQSRMTLDVDCDIAGWDVFLSALWVGGRDLTTYGYEGYNQVDENGHVVASSQKTAHAPAYYLFNTKISKTLSKNWVGYCGVNNILGYTQADNQGTPLMFSPEGHYDVSYIYGPLKGREAYAGIKWLF